MMSLPHDIVRLSFSRAVAMAALLTVALAGYFIPITFAQTPSGLS